MKPSPGMDGFGTPGRMGGSHGAVQPGPGRVSAQWAW